MIVAGVGASPALLGVEAITTEGDVAWSADVVTSDFRTDTVDLAGNVRVHQGALSIESESATATGAGSGSEKSNWTFRDNVHIRTAQADLESNTASATFVKGAIAGARIEGSPARFEQRGDTADRQVSGRAGVIEYDFRSGVVRLEEQVWFSNGKDEFRGDVVIYNVRDERIQINPDGQSGRVQGIIRPRNGASGSNGEPDASPADAPDPGESGA